MVANSIAGSASKAGSVLRVAGSLPLTSVSRAVRRVVVSAVRSKSTIRSASIAVVLAKRASMRRLNSRTFGSSAFANLRETSCQPGGAAAAPVGIVPSNSVSRVASSVGPCPRFKWATTASKPAGPPVEVIRRIMNRSTIAIFETATISKALTGSVCPSGAVAYHSMSGIWWSLASSPCCQSARTRSHRCSASIPQASAASASLTSAAGSLIACAMNRSMTAAGRTGR